MLHNLMALIQEYLLLTDDDEQRGALKSLKLVDNTAQQRDNNKICIWLDDVPHLAGGRVARCRNYGLVKSRMQRWEDCVKHSHHFVTVSYTHLTLPTNREV